MWKQLKLVTVVTCDESLLISFWPQHSRRKYFKLLYLLLRAELNFTWSVKLMNAPAPFRSAWLCVLNIVKLSQLSTYWRSTFRGKCKNVVVVVAWIPFVTSQRSDFQKTVVTFVVLQARETKDALWWSFPKTHCRLDRSMDLCLKTCVAFDFHWNGNMKDSSGIL